MGTQGKDHINPLFNDGDFETTDVPARPVEPDDFDDFDDWILDYIDDEEGDDDDLGEEFSDLGLIDEDEDESGFSEVSSGENREANDSLEPQVYIAHYVSPTTESPVKGFFEFESIHRASSRKNRHDARIQMLEIFGKDAVSWVIDEVKLKRKNNPICGDQMELDFREPKKPRKRRKSKKYW